MKLAEGALADSTGSPRVAAFWAPRFARFAAWFAETERGRRAGIDQSIAEVDGAMVLEGPAGAFTLKARADRIDAGKGGLVITDYKTAAGLANLKRRAEQGEAPQLPLEAAIAVSGGFTGLPAQPVAALRYISASGGEPAGDQVSLNGGDPAALAARAKEGLIRLIARFDDVGDALSRPSPRALHVRLQVRRLRPSRPRRRMVGRDHRGGVSDGPLRSQIGCRRRARGDAAQPGGRRRSRHIGVGQRQCRHGQDARALHAYPAAAAGRHAARAHPGADLYQGGGGGDVEARVRPAGRMGDGRRCGAESRASRSCWGVAPTAEELQRARQLFAIAIETPGGLKVQTIHAFCERLLQRFPLEAGVAPGFAILDEHERAALLAEAGDEVLDEATADPGTPLAKALKAAVAYASDHNFDALLAEALREQDWLIDAVRLDDEEERTFVTAEKIYRRALQLDADAQLTEIEERICSLIPKAELAACGTSSLRAPTAMWRRPTASRPCWLPADRSAASMRSPSCS